MRNSPKTTQTYNYRQERGAVCYRLREAYKKFTRNKKRSLHWTSMIGALFANGAADCASEPLVVNHLVAINTRPKISNLLKLRN